MSGRYPEIVYTEEGMREGMQIEDANIPIDAKVALLEALSETGLKRIVGGDLPMEGAHRQPLPRTRRAGAAAF